MNSIYDLFRQSHSGPSLNKTPSDSIPAALSANSETSSTPWHVVVTNLLGAGASFTNSIGNINPKLTLEKEGNLGNGVVIVVALVLLGVATGMFNKLKLFK